MDKTSAIRSALNKLGERNFTENSSNYAICLEEWNRALLYASAAHSWTFTRSIITLQPRKTQTEDDLLLYDYPPDSLSIIQLVDHNGQRITWRPYANRTLITIGATTEHPTCIYNNNSLTCTNELPDSDPAFLNFFIALLASYIAPCVLGGELGITAAQTLMQEALTYLNEARTRDAQQYASNDDSDPIRTYLRLNSSVRL